jgi:alpha-2-macroglobulin
LAVQAYGPEGAIDVGAEPRVRFNQQVVELGDAMLAEPDLRFDVQPKVKGRTRWRTAELLVFEPEEVAPAQRYNVRLEVLPRASEALKRLFAEHPLAFSFETPGPRVVGSDPQQDTEPEEWTSRQAVLLKLSQPVDVRELRKVLSARSLGEQAERLEVHVDAAGPHERRRWNQLDDDEALRHRLFQVRPVRAWPSDRQIAIEVAAGLVGRLGPVPSAAPWRLTWKTPGPLRVESLRAEEGSCADSTFTVRLSQRVARSQLSRIHISPRPPKTAIELTDAWNEKSGDSITIRGAFVPARTYTVRIDPALRDVNGYTVGDGTGGKAWTSTVSIAGQPSLQLSGDGIFPVGTPPVFGVTTRWVQTLRVRAAILDPARAASGLRPRDGGGPTHLFDQLSVPTKDIVVRDYPLTPRAPTYWSDLAIDLKDLVGDVRGTVAVEVTPLALFPAPKGAELFKAPGLQWAIFRRTDLGPVALHSTVRSVIKVVRLSDARPVGNATVARLDGEQQVLLGHTNDQGLLVLTWQPERSPTHGAPLVISDPATHDYALVSDTNWRRHGSQNEPTGLLHRDERVLLDLTTDRDAYRPGEFIALVGFAMVDTPFARSGLRLLPEGTTVALRVADLDDKTVTEKSLPLDGHAKVWARLPVAKGTRLGSLHITAQAQGTTAHAHVKLEDFRTPEFEVTSRPERDSILIGESAPIRVRANHYSGVPVTFEEVAYTSRCHVTPLGVPNLESGWVVGDGNARHRSTHTTRKVVPEARNAVGNVEFTPVLPTADAKSLLCSIDVQVTDAGRQAIGAETSVRIHPASFYLALRPPRGVYVGDTATVPVRALDIEGKRRGASGIEVKVTRTWQEEVHTQVDGRQRTRWEERKQVAATCRLAASVDKDVPCRVERLQKGSYAIEASARDDTRTARTSATFYAWDRPKPTSPKQATKGGDGTPTHLELAVKRTSGEERTDSFLAPGDHVGVAVSSPCASGGGIALLERAGIREQHDFVLTDHRATLGFAVDDTWTPGVELEVLTVCKSGGDHPKIEQRSHHLAVSSAHRELKVALSVPAHARPGQALPISVEVRDAALRPVKAGHVALWAVDEAVLSLGDYRVKSPLEHFLPRRGGETTTAHEFSSLLHAYRPSPTDPLLDIKECGYGYGVGGLGLSGTGTGGGGYGHGIAVPPPARARFETTPIFLGEIRLDDMGRAHVDGRLPDNLTTFRITAIASAPLVDGMTPGRFGVGETSVVVSSPFILRPSLPRQMRPGDTSEIAAIVQNQTGEAGSVMVTVDLGKSLPVLALLGESAHEAPLASGAQLRVPFRVKALHAGTASVELRARFVPATGEPQSDAVRLPIPVVVEPTLVERTALYGTLDNAAPVAVATRFPASVEPTVGGISLALSTSLLGELQDAFQYLLDYPYGCIEQTSSRVLSLVAARELGRRFGLDGAEAARRLALGIERMLAMQTASGGFAYWPGEERVHPYASAFATWILLLAKQAGGAVPSPTLDRALDYLTGWVEKGGSSRPSEAPWAGASLFESERAIALQVLAEAGRPLPAAALDEAVTGRAELPVFARSLLLGALLRAGDARASSMVEQLLSSVSELPATAHVRESGGAEWDFLFHSQNRSDAIALRVLMQGRPEHPIVPKLVRGLLEARKGGRWRNTQENAYALLAVLEYARRFEAARPDFTARAWVGNRPILDAKLTADLPAMDVAVPMVRILPLPQPVTVVLQRQGEGRLYYRLGTEWQEVSEERPSRDQGLAIERKVRLRRGEYSGSIPVGDAVAFDLTLKNRVPLTYVAIQVPVPAGLEPVLDNLGRGHRTSRLASAGGQLTSHEERHPDRVLLFIDRLSAGEHRHTVQLRAITPGDYALPPACAEAMYMPEIYGRTSGARLTVTSAAQ